MVNLTLSVVFLICSILLTRLYCIVAQGTRLMDKPNERSMHFHPTIRGGGLVFISLALVSIPILCYITKTSYLNAFVFSSCIVMIATVSFLDDLFNLSSKTRFLIQCITALLIVLFFKPSQLDFGFFSINYPVLIIPFIFITVLWAINHFNFMDGIDGFCALQAIFLMVSYAILFGLYGATFYQSFCLILMSSLIGFLFFNFPPARLFMGDVGSASLGLITFCVALIAQQKYHIPILYWFMLNGLFLFDATSTLIRRVIKKEKWSMPHKKHAYQRLRQSGFTVPLILLGQLFLNSSFLILVLLLEMKVAPSILLVLLQMGFIFLIYGLIEKIFPMFQSEFTL